MASFHRVDRKMFPGGPIWALKQSLPFAIILTTVQILVNQSRVWRINLLARREKQSLLDPAQLWSDEKSTSEQVRDALKVPTRDPEGEKLGEKSLPGRILSSMSTFLPIEKLSDEKYLAALERKRTEVDDRLVEIEREEVRIYDYASRGGREV